MTTTIDKLRKLCTNCVAAAMIFAAIAALATIMWVIFL